MKEIFETMIDDLKLELEEDLLEKFSKKATTETEVEIDYDSPKEVHVDISVYTVDGDRMSRTYIIDKVTHKCELTDEVTEEGM